MSIAKAFRAGRDFFVKKMSRVAATDMTITVLMPMRIVKRAAASPGFTLIELLVVIAIIGLLSSVVLASLNNARSKARDARRLGDIRQIQLALELFYDDKKEYPLESVPTYLMSDIADDLVPKYIPLMPADPSHGNTSQGYRYGSTNSSPVNDYAILVNLENDTVGWCRISTSPPVQWATTPSCY